MPLEESYIVRICGAREYETAGVGFWVGPKHVLTLGPVLGRIGSATIFVEGVSGQPGRVQASQVDHREILAGGLPVVLTLLEVSEGVLRANVPRLQEGLFEGGLIHAPGFPDTVQVLWDSGMVTRTSSGDYIIEWRGLGHRIGYAGAPGISGDDGSVVGIVFPAQLLGQSTPSRLIPISAVIEGWPRLSEVSPFLSQEEVAEGQAYSRASGSEVSPAAFADLDAEYKPFPSFSEWEGISVNTVRLDRYSAQLQDRGTLHAGSLERAIEIVRRAAAVESGAIEDLYQTDRGFTMTIATQNAMWEAKLNDKGQKARSLIEAQLAAYEKILTMTKEEWPITEAAIRDLQATVCQGQETFRALTEVGFQELELRKGVYKALPNHVRTREGSSHSYAPVDVTPVEMHRFCQEIESEAFQAAHPILQASYAHYALVAIHPFSDGNGRTARALSSIFTYRSSRVPVLIFTDKKESYFNALAEADAGNFQTFVDFMLERVLDGVQMAIPFLAMSQKPSLGELVSDINALYVTRGGFSQEEVDAAGIRLLQAFEQELKAAQANVTSGNIEWGMALNSGSLGAPPPGYRAPAGPQVLNLNVMTKHPANAAASARITVYVPRDCAGDDDVKIQASLANSNLGKTLLEARITSLMPEPDAQTRVRLQALAEDTLSTLLSQALPTARTNIGRG